MSHKIYSAITKANEQANEELFGKENPSERFQITRHKMIDLFEQEELEIHIDWTGKKVWINGDQGCLLRAYNIKKINLVDDRTKLEEN
jgi:hypothetical protein